MPIDPTTTIGRLLAKTRELSPALLSLIAETDPATFDQKFTAVESGLQEWKTLFEAIDRNTPAEVTAGTSIANLLVRMLTSVKETSERIGATKGRRVELQAAPAAGGKRRKMSRKYCRKTTCKKMGFSQKASCRPYKNCFTRRVRQKKY